MIGLALAGISLASSAYSMWQGNEDAKDQEALAKAQAKQSKATLKLNYEEYSKNAKRDYANGQFVMSSNYAKTINQLNVQAKNVYSQFYVNNASDYSNMSSSYYNDLKNSLESQYSRAMTETTSAMKTNLYRTKLSYLNRSKSKFYEYKDNLKRAELQLDANQIQISSANKQNLMSGAYNMAQVGVQNYYNGNLNEWSGGYISKPALTTPYETGTSSYFS